jgi:AraC-like DNA-binding protein
VGHVIEASTARPFLGLILRLDLSELARLMVDSSLPATRTQQTGRGMAVGRLTVPLLNAFERLIDLLDEPGNIPILAPLVQREILYRLLMSPQGPRLRQIATAGSHSHQIARALDWIRENFDRTLKVDDLASSAGMSASSFHQHFRTMTNMSPLQYQKWIRLHEARRLMLAGSLDATRAAFQVGYESASQFSREYSRLFGAPPLRDIKRMHLAASS